MHLRLPMAHPFANSGRAKGARTVPVRKRALGTPEQVRQHMTRMPERRPSVIVSDEIVPSAAPASCRVLPLPRRAAPHFDDVEARFFQDGDELAQASTTDGFCEWQPERSANGRFRRGL